MSDEAPFEFKASDWFHIKGRGYVCSCEWPDGETLTSLEAAKNKGGRGVTIDGVPATILGVEMFRPLYGGVSDADDTPPGGRVGVLVRELQEHVCPYYPRKVPRCPLCEAGIPRREA